MASGSNTDPPPTTTPLPEGDPERGFEDVPKVYLRLTADLEMVRNKSTFNIRNGDSSGVKSMLIKATIPSAYHWVPILGLRPADGMKAVDAFITSHYHHLKSKMPAQTDDKRVRRLAIALGVSRAVATSMYMLTPDDLVPGETAEPMLRANYTAQNELSFSILRHLSQEMITALGRELALEANERAAISALVPSTVGTIPMQGYSLIMTNHHYLSENTSQSRKVYAVVEKQFWRAPDVNPWFAEDLATIQDALWHKATHPVNMSLKITAATDPRVADDLRAAGIGSAASRLPAVEAEMRAANSYKTLMATVHPLFGIFGGGVDFALLQDAMDMVVAYPVGVDNPEALLERAPSTPPYVTNRKSALQWLGDLVARNSDIASYCYGFYCALSDQNQTLGAGGGVDSLKTSFALSKLRNQSYASFVAGQQAHGDYVSVRNKMRDAGQFKAPKMTVI